MKPLSVTRFLTIWYADSCEFERVGKQQIHVFEPLNIDAPPDARCSATSWDLTFYSKDGNQCLGRCHTHRFSRGVAPELLMIDGEFWELSGGELKYRQGRWNMVWFGWRNTRAAIMARKGWPHYRR